MKCTDSNPSHATSSVTSLTRMASEQHQLGLRELPECDLTFVAQEPLSSASLARGIGLHLSADVLPARQERGTK